MTSDERQNRRRRTRGLAYQFTCPTCGAAEATTCSRSDGTPRTRVHIARAEIYRDVYGCWPWRSTSLEDARPA